MSYIIQCDDGYVAQKKGKYCITSNKDEAFVIVEEQAAKNILKSSLPKEIRENNPIIISNGDVINNEYTPIDMDNVKTLICSLSDQFKAMKGNKEWLLEMESKIDREISDILHYIEFYPFNACDGYKLAKDLRDLRLKRRDVKNQLEAIQIISSHSCNMLADGRTNKALCEIENKEYKPRILTELFAEKAN